MPKTALKLSKTAELIWKKGKAGPMPQDLEPMLATLVTQPVEDEGWVYEMKWDGYRALAYLENGKVDLRSRNNKSFNEKFYPIYDTIGRWGINALVDGEILVLNDQGLPDFSDLQLWRSEADGHLVFYAFDLLWLEGRSLLDLPMEERRQLLKSIMPGFPAVRLSESLSATGEEAFKEANQM